MSRRTLCTILVLSMITTMSCNTLTALTQGASTPEDTGAANVAPQTTPTAAGPAPEYYDLDGNPIYPEPIPSETVELMMQQVDDGQVSLEDGVLGLLHALVGEGDAPSYTQNQEGGVTFRSMWGLTQLAAQVYNESDDPEVRAEIDRLLGILAPSQEALDRYAEPVDAKSRTGGGELASPIQQTSCAEIVAEGFPEKAGPVPTCLEYSTFTENGSEYRVYRPIEDTDDPEVNSYVEAASQALSDSVTKYSQYTALGSVDLVFTPWSSQTLIGMESVHAMVPRFEPGEFGDRNCPIVIFPGYESRGIPKFQQTVAHEMFHCVELWHKGYLGYKSSAWWVEGMATYFGNVVYPDVNSEWVYTSWFDEHSVTKSIFEMTYDDFEFFEYLGGRFGDPWLIALMDQLPVTGLSTMINIMASQDNIEQVFHDFGHDYLLGMIPDTGVGMIPGAPRVSSDHELDFPGGGTFTFKSKPFHLERGLLSFDPKRRYTFDLKLDGDPADQTVRKVGGGDLWFPMPSDIIVCEEPLKYNLLVSTTIPSSESSTAATFRVSLKEEKESECDTCLVGVWETDIGASDSWNAVRANIGSTGTQLESVTGLQQLIFYEDGTYESAIEGWELVWVGPPSGGNIAHTITTTERTGQGTYATVDKQLLQMFETSSDFYQETVTVISGPLGTFSTPVDVRTEGGGYFTASQDGSAYSCTDSNLTYEGVLVEPSWTGPVEYTRISSVPPTPAGPEQGP